MLCIIHWSNPKDNYSFINVIPCAGEKDYCWQARTEEIYSNIYFYFFSYVYILLQYVKSLVKAFVSWLNPFKAVYRSTLIQIRESGSILTGFVKPAYSFKKFHHSDYSHSGHGQPQGRTKYCVHFRTSQLWVFPTGIMSCETIVVILMVMCFINRVVLFNTILCTCYLGNKSILFLYDELLLSLIYPHQRCFVLVIPCAKLSLTYM